MQSMSNPYALSVVLPVYQGVEPDHLRRAIQSIYEQTLPAAEILVIEDGPLLVSQLRVLDEFHGSAPPLKRIALPENRGAGPANDAGLRAATSPWIAKMDSDDVALPTRFERQVHAIASDSSYDLVGSAMHEFDGDEDNIVGTRRMPETHEAISKYVRINNPVNHPTIIFRRALALEVGGYRALPYLEDYEFVARLIAGGAHARNLPDALLLFRTGDELFKRRKAQGAFVAEIHLQRSLRELRLIGPVRACANLLLRWGYRLVPARLLRRLYVRLFYR